MVDLLFNHLRNIIKDGIVPVKELPWGSEISRLCSASVLAVPHNPENVEITIPEPPKFVS